MELVNTDWNDILNKYLTDDINTFLDNYQESYLPKKELIFEAFNHFNFDELKIVILALDPYPNKDYPNGIAYSVQQGVKVPSSLKNIYKELVSEGIMEKIPDSGVLLPWVQQGILLMNSALTVQEGMSNSHAKIWKKYTDSIIAHISKYSKEPVVFLLMGGNAQKKEKIIIKNSNNHLIVKTAHPSPLSCKKFFGCGCFEEINIVLLSLNKEPINWDTII